MISKKIIQRILDHNKITAEQSKYFANDNIADFIENGELPKLEKEVTKNVEKLLRSLVIDIDSDHNTKETAKRLAKMFLNETMSGRYRQQPHVTAFPNVTNYDGIYVTGPISIRSICAHHFQNIVGKCWIGVKPQSDVIGLSKFNRIVHWYAERPQIQEELTQQIADHLQKATGTDDIAVIIKAEHQCMTMRGVKEHENDMVTAILRGTFRTEKMRDEFYSILNLNKTY